MILQELVRYYDRKALDPDPAQRLPSAGLEDKEIPFLIELASNGRVLQLIDTRELVGKKLQARSFLVPLGEKKTSGIKANLLWDSAAYVVGLDTGRKNNGDTSPTAAFRARIEALPDAARADAGVRAVLAALDQADWSVLQAHPAWADISEANLVMTFRLAGDIDLVCQRPAVIAAAVASTAPGDERQLACLIDGVPAPVQRLHASIKGVWGAQSSGANIVSFNARAFESYGKTERQGENAPVGQRAAFAYTTALNHLLDKGSRNRVQVGDASTVFWADSASAFDSEFTLADFFGESKDEPDRGVRAVQALYQAQDSGQLPVGERDVTYFVLGLAPNAARISIRFWLQARFADLAPRILRHFDDLRVVRRFDSDPLAPSLFRLLSSLALQGKLDNVPPRLAGEWMRAILEGQPYPATLLNAAVMRCRAEQEVTYLRAAVLKAWLNRDHRRSHPHTENTSNNANDNTTQHFKERLDVDQTDTPYRLGRLFAVLEHIQRQAMPGINATIRDRYYSAASTTPVAVFTTLLRLKNAHLKKLNEGQAVWFERLIGEVLAPLQDFPRQLTLPQQGRFALGYYHQRQDFFTRKDADASSSKTQEE
jgi:CRISPR-associated protein Csd1